MFLNSGWNKVDSFIQNLFQKELSQIGIDQEFRDSKTELQELLQSKKLSPPKYLTEEFNNGFNSKIELNEGSFSASGNSKRQAERAVALEALTYLKSNNA